MSPYEIMIKERLEDMQNQPEKDLWNRILKSAMAKPKDVQFLPRKKTKALPKSIAVTAAIFILLCMFNITAVVAFIKNILFFVPGFGVTENDMSVVMLKEPVEMDCEFGKFTVEFGTKTGGGGKCEIMLFLTTRDNIYASGVWIEGLNAATVIDGVEYILKNANPAGVYCTYQTVLCMKNEDFPDINDFDLTFGAATVNIVMTELTEKEKTPYLSKENNGIILAAYKYRNNNQFIGFDVITGKSTNDFTQTFTYISGYVYDDNNDEIKLTGGGLIGLKDNFESSLANGLLYLDNEDNTEIKKIAADCVIVGYNNYFEEMNITIPIPEDGQTVYTNIEVPVADTVYKITEVKRKGEIIYFKDNSVFYNEPVDREKAVQNFEKYITHIWLENMGTGFDGIEKENKITGFNVGDDSFTVRVLSIEVAYYGDFTVDFAR